MDPYLDTSALTEPLAPSEVPDPPRSGAALVVFLLALVFLGAGAGATWWAFPLDSDGGPRLALTLLVIALAMAAVCLWMALVLRRKARERAALRHRLQRFAVANHRTFLLDQPAPRLPGLLFGQGTQQSTTEALRWTARRPVEVGNYRFVVGRGRSTRIFDGGYLAIRTGRSLPPLVLEPARARGILRRHLVPPPSSFAAYTLRSADGTVFRLWAPAERTAEAAAFLSGPCLDLLTRHARDLEVADGTVLVYSAAPLLTADPGLWTWIEEVVAALQPDDVGQRPHLMREELLPGGEGVRPVLAEDLEADRPEH
ncbi:MAG: hypothetical protein J7474_00600 [Arthrobacter sp.]|nr:hypothetical protein [Arthrobacter sp.]